MLKPGAITVDLQTGGIYGDIDHCPLPDLLESADALWSLLPKINHKGLWALAKAFDADCYLCTSTKYYSPPDDIRLEQDIYRGAGGLPTSQRPFKFIVIPSKRQDYFDRNWYEPLIGSLRDGKATSNTNGIPDLTAKAIAEKEQQRREFAKKETNKGKQQAMFGNLPMTTAPCPAIPRRVSTARSNVASPSPAARPIPTRSSASKTKAAEAKEGGMKSMF